MLPIKSSTTEKKSNPNSSNKKVSKSGSNKPVKQPEVPSYVARELREAAADNDVDW